MRGRIIKAIAGFFYCYGEDSVTYACRAKGIFRKEGLKPLVGDEVLFSVVHEKDQEGNVEQVLPRKNALVRPSVANVDQALLVVAARDPDPNALLMERFLAILATNKVPTALAINKADLAEESALNELSAPYRGADRRVFLLSAKDGEGLASLKEYLKGKTTVVAGPSGVGKSTLTNALGGDDLMETGEISKKLGRGRHTTRHCQLIPLSEGTYLVDTPGFTSLALPPMEQWDLGFLYPEFDPYRGDCYFQPCLHEHEPDCAVKNAMGEGKIHPKRYEGYLNLLAEVRAQRKY